jgi:CDP-diacylglycerol--serine O-phosphatidyltransferase
LRGRERVRNLRKRIPSRLRGRRLRVPRPKPILKLISPADMITLMNFLCGVFAVMSSVDGGDGLRKAMYLIALGMIFDGLDGPVARRYGTSHRFGVWLDSLADAVTFCIAPAILVYNLFKDPSGVFFGSIQDFIAITSSVGIALLGILRLARFSFYAHKWKDFIGLPTPAMALIIVCISSSYYWSTEMGIEIDYVTSGTTIVLPIVFFLIALTMVADLRYRKYRGKIMILQGLVIIMFISSLGIGLYYPIVGLTAGITFSGVSLLYLISPFANRPDRIWGASKWADLVDEETEEPFYDDEEMVEEEYEV